MSTAYNEIAKELHYPNEDVSANESDHKQRRSALERALVLGSLA